MAVPAFSFTSRAVPVAQIGRADPLDPADVTWVDIGCDVYEITTDTGRGSASDRFVPGTAVITASNVSGWADAVVPLEWTYFADDFERSGPTLGSHWERWPVVEADRNADVLLIDTGAAQVQGRPVPPVGLLAAGDCELVGTYSLIGDTPTPTATIGPFPGVQAGDVVVVGLQVRVGFDEIPTIAGGWARTGKGNLDEWRYDTFEHRITAEEAALGDPWTATWSSAAPWNWLAVAVRGAGTVTFLDGTTTTWGAGTTGFFQDLADDDFGVDTSTAGSLVVRFSGGEHHHTIPMTGVVDLVQSAGAWDAMQFVDVDGPLPFGTFVGRRQWAWSSPSTSVSGEGGIGQIIIFVPGPAPDSLEMQGASCALWGQQFDGDHFVDTFITGLAAPERVWPDATTTIELLLHASPDDLAATVAVLDWVPSWDDPGDTGRMDWSIRHRNTVGVDTIIASGYVDFGADGFPEPAHLRFEADVAGPVRLYFQDVLLGSGIDGSPYSDGQIGVFASYFAGALSYGHTIQPGPPRFEQVVAGSNIPVPILVEPGVRVRIGVHHQVHGDRWFFHGYVDGIVPVYNPEHPAVSNIECIDALGEVGRLPLTDVGGFDPEEAWERVTRLVNEAVWPLGLRDIADDATWMTYSSAAPDRALELLTQTAESCGGAVYGDPANGHVVFRGRDWQAWDPEAPPDGYITNGPVPSGALAACPSTWERSWRREDMTTRVTFTSGHGEEMFNNNPDAEARFGVESYDRSLVAIEPRILRKLGRRQLRLRGPGAFPRVNAVLLDARSGDGAVDVMTLSTFTLPSRYLCGLIRDGTPVFERQYLVTGVRHTIARDRWQCRLELDVADVFATKGARWGRGHWSRTGDVWGASI